VAILRGSPPHPVVTGLWAEPMTAPGPSPTDLPESAGPGLPPNQVRVAAVEACAWIGEPLSARLLREVLLPFADLNTVAYHLIRLADAGVLIDRPSDEPEGPAEHFYALAR
jgi:hypothetical protein